MQEPSSLNRRQLLQALALAGAGLGSVASAATSGPHGVDPRLRRGYSRTRFGLVHHWITGHGPFLLAVHQSAQSSEEYAAVAPLLGESFRVIAIDLPGHGRSDTPDHEPTMDEYIEATMAVLDDLGIRRTHVVGHHGGCDVALGLSVKQPERVDKVVFSGAGLPDRERALQAVDTPMTRDLPIDADGEFLAKTWKVYRKMSAAKTPPEISFLPFLVSLQARLRPYDMHRAAYLWDSMPALERFHKPTLLIKAAEDMYSGNTEGLHEYLKGSKLTVLPDCGAWLFYERPEACAKAILDYLKG